MSAQAIGALFPGIIERAKRLRPIQQAINCVQTSDGRKAVIMCARERKVISDDDAVLLIQAYGLETA